MGLGFLFFLENIIAEKKKAYNSKIVCKTILYTYEQCAFKKEGKGMHLCIFLPSFLNA